MKTINEIKMLTAKKGITLTRLAEYLSEKLQKKITVDNLSKKLRGNTIRYSHMKILAEAMDMELVFKDKE